MIQRVVVDASVAAQWLLPEETTPAALQILSGVPLLLAPTLIYAEVANVLWKRVQRQEISLAAGEYALNLLKELPLQTFSPVHLLPTAWGLATEHGVTMYDALYVALSQEQDAPLITADRPCTRSLHNMSRPLRSSGLSISQC